MLSKFTGFAMSYSYKNNIFSAHFSFSFNLLQLFISFPDKYRFKNAFV